MTTTRRRLLQWTGTGLGAALAAPSFLFSRRASAATGLAGPGCGAIIYVLNGGARTQAVFNGTVGLGTNPFGAVTGLKVPVSKTLEGTGLDTAAINDRFNLVTACQHHNRTGNHETGRVVACTGYEPQEDRPGILTLLNYVFATRTIPCVHIGNDTPATLIGSEISSTFSPIKLGSPLNVDDIKKSIVDVQVSAEETARYRAFRDKLQDRFLRSSRNLRPGDIPFYQRKAAEVAAQFNSAALDIRANASLGKYVDGTDVTNAGLRTAFGVTATGGGSAMGARAMLALRLRQLWCAGICLSSDNWDLHSGELDVLPGKAADVGKSMAALIDQMSRIRDPLSGKTLLDTTVVTAVSDFNRGNWNVGTGFNGSNGSDHLSGDDKTSFQCVPLFGGGLPGGKVLGQLLGNGAPEGSSKRYETRQILATVLDVLGVPSESFFPASVVPLTRELAP